MYVGDIRPSPTSAAARSEVEVTRLRRAAATSSTDHIDPKVRAAGGVLPRRCCRRNGYPGAHAGTDDRRLRAGAGERQRLPPRWGSHKEKGEEAFQWISLHGINIPPGVIAAAVLLHTLKFTNPADAQVMIVSIPFTDGA